MLTSRCLLFFLAAFSGCQLYAQELHLPAVRIELAGGYTGNRVLCLLKDKTGYLWIGVHDGLFRYDGHKTININEIEGVNGHLSDNHINGVAEDTNGILWIQTPMALHRFDTKSGKLEPYINTSGCYGRNSDIMPSQVGTASDGALWWLCGVSSTLRMVLGRDSLSPEIQMRPCDNRPLLDKILSEKSESYFVGVAQARILKKCADGLITSAFNHKELMQPGARVYLLANLCETKSKRFIFLQLNTNELICYNNLPANAATGKYVVVDNKESIVDIETDANDNCWLAPGPVAEANAIKVYNPVSGKLKFAGEEVLAWTQPNVHCLLPDEEGLLWMGTDNGVVRTHMFNNSFKKYLYQKGDNLEKSNYSIRAMFE
ncbi:MAG: response regulator, partial [Bacteroidota bacterium]|nr:response regulator [Bacteroidota bacterium]